MKSSAISRGLCLALLATAARAQNVAAGARALVTSETLSVYAAMSVSSPIKATLTRGDTVSIGLVLFGEDITWCAISKGADNRRLGYVSCEFLAPDRPAPAAEPAPEKAAPPPAAPVPVPVPAPAAAPVQPKPPPRPFTIREVAPPAPIALAEPPSIPAPPPPAPPVAPPVSDKEFLAVALDASGLRSSILNYTQDTHLLSFLDKGRLAELDVAALDRILSQQFQPAPFYTAITAQLRKNYSPDRARPVLEWLKSPTTVKLAGLERRALRPESHSGLVAFAALLSKSPPPESRLLLVHRLYDSLRTCDMEVDTTISLVQTVALAIGPALPVEKRYTAAVLKEALAPVKVRYSSIMKNARLVRYLFAYGPATDADLEEHVNFLESDAGKWFISTVEKGFFDAKEVISRALNAEISRKVKNTGKPQ